MGNFTVQDYLRIVNAHISFGELDPAITSWERRVIQENVGYFIMDP